MVENEYKKDKIEMRKSNFAMPILYGVGVRVRVIRTVRTDFGEA
jgi:hypothetical protein